MRARFLPVLIGAVAISSSAGATAGCSRAHAKTAPDLPPLEVPAAPPRDVEPIDMEAPPPVPLPGEPVHRPPVRPRPPARPEPAREAPKGEAKPEAPPEAPKPTEEPPKPPSLQTTPPGNENEVEHAIRTTMGRASTDLNRIDYRTLNEEARRQYDTAKGYVRRAERALQDHNLMFAKELADKAADLAVQLAPKK